MKIKNTEEEVTKDKETSENIIKQKHKTPWKAMPED
jgi:hypothetical protein